MTTGTALLLADLSGVAVFAASGASVAVVKRFDLFGVVFVGFVVAHGGIVRDLVIDVVPPFGLRGGAAVLVTGVRLLALRRRWSAPVPSARRPHPGGPSRR